MRGEPSRNRDILTVPEAAERLGIARTTLWRWIRAGGVPFVIQVGQRTRVSAPRLERYLHGEDGAA